MADEIFSNVWEALCETPEEAANMTMRSDLMRRIQDAVDRWEISQTEAAKRLNISQPRLNDLLKDRLAKFSLDALVVLAVRAGLTVRLEVGDGAALAA